MKKNKLLFSICVFIYGLFSYFSRDYFYPDEHFQIIEFASYKLGVTSASDLSWEYIFKMRPSIQPWILYCWFYLLSIFGIRDPFILMGSVRLITGLFSFFSFYIFSSKILEKNNLNQTPIFLYFSLCFVVLPFFGVRFSSETLSMILLVWILYIYFHFENRPKYILVGILFGFLFFVKFQMAIIIIAFGLFLLYSKVEFHHILWMFLGFIFSVGINILLDSLFYGSFQITFYNYFEQNFLFKKSELFGKEPIYYYFISLFLFYIPFISFIWLYVFFKGIKNQSIKLLTFVFVFFIIINSIISHKEFRFLTPILFLSPSLFYITYLTEKNKVMIKLFKVIVIIYLIFNTLLLTICFIPLRFKYNMFQDIYTLTSGKKTSKLIYLNEHPYKLKQVIKPDIYFSFYKPKNLCLEKLSSNTKLDQHCIVIVDRLNMPNKIIIQGLTFYKYSQTISEELYRKLPVTFKNSLDAYSIYIQK